MEDGSGWTPKDGKTENGVDRYILRKDIKEKGVKIEEAQYQSTWRLKTPCADPNKRKAEEEET